MDLGQAWFIINIFFVAALIMMLFVQRQFAEGVHQQLPREQLVRLKRKRDLLLAVSIILFVAMAGTFLADMRFNG
ncbi:hypothetical protein [Paenibacillus sp. 1P07SE]|uniref:hypothetical protein n=1 Tax=Paenibacillus sp. 1P07SE TaxID=3132209 RepID=UPI0039A5DAD6